MKFLFIAIFSISIFAQNLIKPIPQSIEFNKSKAELGKILFFDANLSNDGEVSCASCHRLDKCGADDKAISKGSHGAMGEYNAPSVYNLAFFINYNWIGDAQSIEEQMVKPITSKFEFNSSFQHIIQYISSNEELKKRFLENYSKIDRDTILKALAEYIKSLITPNSRFDKFLRGDKDAITTDEKLGYKIFIKHGCISCHNGVNIGANMLQKFGVFKHRENIEGRFEHTKQESDIGVFRVPSLRNISQTAPYFHDGKVATLKESIEMMADYQLGIELSDEEVELISKFLKSLDAKVINE